MLALSLVGLSSRGLNTTLLLSLSTPDRRGFGLCFPLAPPLLRHLINPLPADIPHDDANLSLSHVRLKHAQNLLAPRPACILSIFG